MNVKLPKGCVPVISEATGIHTISADVGNAPAYTLFDHKWIECDVPQIGMCKMSLTEPHRYFVDDHEITEFHWKCLFPPGREGDYTKIVTNEVWAKRQEEAYMKKLAESEAQDAANPPGAPAYGVVRFMAPADNSIQTQARRAQFQSRLKEARGY